MRILIADDDPIANRVMRTLLERAGHEVRAVGTGEDAWAALTSDEPPRVLLLDWMLPDLEGVEICRRVRARGATPYTYIILVTSRSDTEDLVQAFQAGADDFIAKPFQHEELLARVRAGERIVSLEAELRVAEEKSRANERRLAHFIEALPAAVVVADAAGRFCYTNELSRELLGDVTDDSSLASRAFRSGTNTRYPVGEMPIARARRGEQSSVDDIDAEGPFGRVPIQMTASPLPDGEGRTEFAIAVISDIRVRKATEDLLEAEKMLLGLIARSAPIEEVLTGVCKRVEHLCKGAQVSIMLVSPDGSELRIASGPSLSMETKRTLGAAEIGPDKTACGAAVYFGALVIESARAPAFKQDGVRLRTLGIESQWAMPIVGANGRVLGVLAALFTTQRAPDPREEAMLERIAFLSRLAIEREQMQSQLFLADRMASVGTLAAGVAHEINNPLAYVVGNLEYVQSTLSRMAARPGKNELDEMKQALEEAQSGAARVRDIVSDLRTLSRADDSALVPTDVREVLTVAVRLAGHTLRHSTRIDLELEEVPRVMANESRLGQVFANMLANAAQAMPERDAQENVIAVRTRKTEEDVTIELSDNGSGMSPSVVKRVFDPFFTTKPVGGGTGLGLSICHSIVSAIGGTIVVESAVGVGTTIRVSLPIAGRGTARPTRLSTEPPPRRRARILVVDDEPFVNTMVKRMLSSEHEIVFAGSGAEAVELVRHGERYDAVLCDLMMPGMTGMDVFACLERDAPGLARRTGFLTGGAFTERARAFLDDASAPHLTKPFDARALRQFVRELTEAA